MQFKYFFYFFLFLIISFSLYSRNLINKKAPVFQASAVFTDGSVGTFNLSDYFGKKIVLYFYPMDNTPGCSCQAKNFKDNIKKLENENIVLIGISCDSINSHKNFQKKYSLPYILISDSRISPSISKMYGVNSFFMSKRKTFLIDPQGTVFKKFDKIIIEEQVDQIINSFQKHLSSKNK